MSDRYKGAILSPTAPTVIPQSAGGVYTLSQQTQYQGQGVWPSAINNPVNNSLRFRSSASAYLNKTFASNGTRTKGTYSTWFKIGTLPSTVTIPLFGCGDTASDSDTSFIAFYPTFGTGVAGTLALVARYGGGTVYKLFTNAVFRDPSAWYHIVVSWDTTLATPSGKIYINGVEQSYGTNTWGTQTQNQNTYFSSSAYPSVIGKGANNADSAKYADGYMAEINFIDGQALTPSSFGTTDAYGIWQPIPYTGAYGTNGFYLPFTDNSALTTSSNVGLGKDFSGNGNYWVTNNISITAGSTYDSMTDVPTNTNSNTANYCTMNPLDAQGTATLTDANLTLASSSTTHRNRKATFVVPSTGKWYWELTTASTCSSSVILGWGLQTTAAATDSQAGNANTWMAQNDANQDIWNQTTNVLSTGSAVAGGSIRQVAYDADSGKLWFGINNTWYSSTDLTSGNPSAGTNPCITLTSGSYFPTVTCYNLTANVNFGQRPFAYTPPSGFYPLNTYNLPTPTILDGDQYFNATLYTGNNSTQSVTGVGFQPDFVWIKERDAVEDHFLFDALRGATNFLRSNTTDAQGTLANYLTAFNSDGFSLGNGGGVNGASDLYVSWNWRASNAAGVTNTQGTITSTVSANTTAGFSIVTYTGNGTANSTVGHGLGVTPNMIIAKVRSTTESWPVFHSSLLSLGTGYYLELNATGAAGNGNSRYPSAPNSTVVTIGSAGNITPINGNGQTYVMYCFAQVAGYSAFGSYTGNGSSDGPFVYTGFRPRYVLIKRTDSATNWYQFDTARNTYNVMKDELLPNSSNPQEDNSRWIDCLSNGFKIRNDNVGQINANGGTFIYMAFAENPFKIARAR